MKKKDDAKEKQTITIHCTPYQAKVIRDTCGIYGRMQIGQYEALTKTILGARFYEPEESQDLYQTDRKLWERLQTGAEFLESLITTTVDTFGTSQFKRRNRELVAMDIWAKLDKRREDDDFTMGSEPMIRVEEKDSKKEGEKG